MEGLSFLDIGCGSGLFSLAALRLGAERVHSFDFDQDSVAATGLLKARFAPDAAQWTIETGSVLDTSFLASLGTFDMVYAWGVLHHTGRLWEALTNLELVAKPGGKVFISLYNDAGRASRTWTKIKRAYVRHPAWRPAITVGALLRCWGPTIVRDLYHRHPLATWKGYGGEVNGRGMSPWTDLIDWVGGYPFEPSSPGVVFNFLAGHGYELIRLRTVSGALGCNEFLLTRGSAVDGLGPPVPSHIAVQRCE